ncbi:hypothetical protein SAMN03159507_02020 [Pseudomonas sp. NFACC32-1]|uniref:hypothetical protein n=1 Tax=Pseudomonas TaxID=286 RepID=UPI0008767D7A|nr:MULTISPECIES: hypothetical protein [Pseudomonas]MDB6446698.1 hypothetical protein [Pseudomonas sp. 21TX0197]MDT8906576.1 hypothetical protein [Pseudomonas prosekii]NHN67030.1 hypothetical protein [Pseudomonas fluorescens]ROO39098.1 hypothetical protein BIV09_12650 [Pseudomonas sp. 7SR1]ROO40539.1 hypothetical protein BIV08_16050 [Pseudomonas sp. AF76]
MITVDAAVEEFVRLLDVATAIAQEMKNSSRDAFVIQAAEVTIKNLKGFRSLALSGGLPRPSRGEVALGAGLDLRRGVGEWAGAGKLVEAIGQVEHHYEHSL